MPDDSDSNAQPAVAIILVNYRGWRDTIECLESLFRLTYQNRSVFIVDNGSMDGSLERIAKWANGNLDIVLPTNPALTKYTSPRVKKPLSYALYSPNTFDDIFYSDPTKPPVLHLIQSVENRGFAAGNNLALGIASENPEYKHFWILNNDTVVEFNALTELVNRIESEPKIDMCGSTCCYYDRPELVQARGGATYNKWFAIARQIDMFLPVRQEINAAKIEKQMNYVAGASMLVSRDYLDTVGFMNERYFLYFEEIDWVTRGKRKKFKIGYAPKSMVYHKEGVSTGANDLAGTKTILTDFHGNRNRLLFTKQYHWYCLPTVWFALWISFVRRLFRGKWKLALQILGILFGRSRPIPRKRHFH